MPEKRTPHKFKVGLVQMSSSNQMAENIISAETLIREAVSCGAQMVLTPEMTTLMELHRPALLEKTFIPEEDPGLCRFRALAQELDIWLVIGSLSVKVDDKNVNRCYVLAPDGTIAAHYDKIHMFDVDLPGGEQYRESRSYQAGKRAVVTKTPWGDMGLTICYDLRFPGLYRKLAHKGAVMISVPAAFTQVTGDAHWHVLLRARAIENGAFIFAPAQTGSHKNALGITRDTFGHSLIIDPWGNIIDDGGTGRGVIVAEVDLDLVKQARLQIPSLNHDRMFD